MPTVEVAPPLDWVAHPVWDFTLRAPAAVDVFAEGVTDYTIYTFSVRGPPRRGLGLTYAGYHPGFPRRDTPAAEVSRFRLAGADARGREWSSEPGTRSREVLVELPVEVYGAPLPPGVEAYTAGDARYLHFWYLDLPEEDAALMDSIIATLQGEDRRQSRARDATGVGR